MTDNASAIFAEANVDDDTDVFAYPPPPDRTITLAEAQTLCSDVDAALDITVSIKGGEGPANTHSSVDLRELQVVEGATKAVPPPHFRLREKIGEGGMGVVYEAEQTSFARTVALKMIKAGKDSAAARAKFLSEAVVQGELDHPNIPPAYELGRNAQGEIFFAMKKVVGTPWSESMADTPQRENVGILLRVADAIAFAHTKGIVHRDLKPENVMLGDYGEVLVMDWGLAVSVNECGRADRLAPDAPIAGTIAYMAPEMASGQNETIGFASDIYLLGAILYEIVSGHPPHNGKTLHEAVMNASNNVIAPTENRGELAKIAIKAMATAPADRYPSVDAFRTAVRAYQRHAESLVMSERATADLDRAARTRDYEDYAQAIFGFKQALGLWAKNRKATAGLLAARTAHANTAFQKGDFDVALGTLEASRLTNTPLYKQIRYAKAKRERRVKQARTMTRAAVGLLLLVIIISLGGGWWISRKEARLLREAMKRQSEWIDVGAWDFAQTKTVPDGWAVQGAKGGKCEPAPDRVVFENGSLHLTRLKDSDSLAALVWQGDPLDGDMAVEVDVTPGISIGVCVGGDIVTGYRTLLVADAGHDQAGISLERGMDNDWEELSKSSRPLPRQETYRMRVELAGQHVRVFVNGVQYIDYFDPMPPRGREYQTAAISHGWGKADIHRLRLARRRRAQMVPVLEVGRELIRADNLAEAEHFFRDIYATFPPEFPERLEAQLLLGITLSLQNKHDQALQAFGAVVEEGMRGEAEDSHKRQLAGIALMEAMKTHAATSAWDKAASASLDAKELNPGSTAVDRLHKIIQNRFREMRYRDDKGNVVILEENGNRVSRLSLTEQQAMMNALARLRVKKLNLQGVDSLRGLEGMNTVTWARIGGHFDDLSPIKDMPLSSLQIYGRKITDLSPLKGMALEKLDFYGNQITDLSPLKGMALKELLCGGNQITDLSPLKGMALKELLCGGNQITDLSPLQGMALKEINCGYSRITDLSPLKGMALKELLCGGNQITDLSPLKGMALKVLQCPYNQITDLSPLKGMDLKDLRCGNNQIADLSPLQGMDLKELHCGYNQITDLSPLKGMALKVLHCGYNQITDLSPLQGMALKELVCGGNQITDFSPLRDMHLDGLRMLGIPLNKDNAAMILALPLQRLFFSPELTDDSALRAIFKKKGLAGLNNFEPACLRRLWPDLKTALAGQPARLKRHGVRMGKTLVLPIPLMLSRKDAAAMARREGAVLFCPSTEEKVGAIETLIRGCASMDSAGGEHLLIHIGAAMDGKAIRWANGDPWDPQVWPWHIPPAQADRLEAIMWIPLTQSTQLNIRWGPSTNAPD